MKGSSPWTMTPTQPLSPSCLTTAPALQPLDPLVSARLTYTAFYWVSEASPTWAIHLGFFIYYVRTSGFV